MRGDPINDITRLYDYWFNVYKRPNFDGREFKALSLGSRGRKSSQSVPLERFRAMKVDPIGIDASVLEDAKTMVALELCGYYSDDIDTKLHWKKGRSAELRSKYAVEVREAECLQMEAAAKRFKQASMKLYQLLGNSVEVTVLFNAQVVQGGGPHITPQFRSEQIREVTPEDATIAARLKASDTILKFTQFIYQESKRNADDPMNRDPLPESFAQKVEAAADKVSNLRLVTKEKR